MTTSPSPALESLLAACRDGDVARAREIIQQQDGKSLVNATNDNEDTPLITASRHGHSDVVAILLELGAGVNASKPTNGVTALYIAAQEGHADVVNQLIKHKADVNLACTDDGWTPLMATTQINHSGIAAALLSVGADANAVDSEGASALFWRYKQTLRTLWRSL